MRSLIQRIELNSECSSAIAATARALVTRIRQQPRPSGVNELMKEYSLSSDEGIALMCLSEALLRIPDNRTRDALIKEKIGDGNWAAHVSGKRSMFTNAATWSLVLTGRLLASTKQQTLTASLSRIVSKFGEPIIRNGIDTMIRIMGRTFVAGQTIEKALRHAQAAEQDGFTHSFDMLGEGALTQDDAERYYNDYEQAVRAIGAASAGKGVYRGPGISIKLSALHPRYTRSQVHRVYEELLPRVKRLAVLAKQFDIGLNIDAEEADRLGISLVVLEELAFDPTLNGWNGLGFVVQAYSKRCDAVIDYLTALAKRSGRRLMVRLVKGAYWDTEIKRAQIDGLKDFPVFTRKVHTDLSYIAAARKLLSVRADIYPQFATHNAQTLATICHLAGADFDVGDYEFQCLHGMGEALYTEVVGPAKLNRPCRIYAPVGQHQTLLAYLVRRLLENGANSSFVNRVSDERIPLDALIEAPATTARNITPIGSSNPLIALPSHIFGVSRDNSQGLDLSDDRTLLEISAWLSASRGKGMLSAPAFRTSRSGTATREVTNPGDRDDRIGEVIDCLLEDVEGHVKTAAASHWPTWAVKSRTASLRRAADLMESEHSEFLPILMREAGKTAGNAVAEIREAVDFLRYYALQAEQAVSESAAPLGVVACISPWNFPLAIFVGQIAAALAGGNVVLAKPAEETPLVATFCVNLLHRAGVPGDALQLLQGDGKVGAALVASEGITAVVFTGSGEAARSIQKTISRRVTKDGKPVVLIAETGGLNAMIADSSALPEQVVNDVIVSAFDSAGQRCSALRLLCIQEDSAERVLTMLKGAMSELQLGSTDAVETDVGPIISAAAARSINAYIAAMKSRGFRVTAAGRHDTLRSDNYVSPVIIELDKVADLQLEVFGPVLHVVTYKADELDNLVTAINSSGYALTFGLHTRISSRVEQVVSRVNAGNVYVNRNMVGAVVGSQPFGGRGRSGTGPKAGGPLYIHRLLDRSVPSLVGQTVPPEFNNLKDYLVGSGWPMMSAGIDQYGRKCPVGASVDLPGPVGETNRYSLRPGGTVLLCPDTSIGLIHQIAACLVSGNNAVLMASNELVILLAKFPEAVRSRVRLFSEVDWPPHICAVLIEGGADRVCRVTTELFDRTPDQAAIPVVQALTREELVEGRGAYNLYLLVDEVSVSINTAAAGGNASLMAIG